MPLPIPRRDEDREPFISRCMSNPTMRREFPSRDQRLAVCNRQYRKGRRRQREDGEGEDGGEGGGDAGGR